MIAHSIFLFLNIYPKVSDLQTLTVSVIRKPGCVSQTGFSHISHIIYLVTMVTGDSYHGPIFSFHAVHKSIGDGKCWTLHNYNYEVIHLCIYKSIM